VDWVSCCADTRKTGGGELIDMPSYLTIFSATLPVFFVVAIGFLFHRRGWLSEETETGMMKIGLNLLTPCLILSLIPGNPALKTVAPAAWAIGLGFALTVAGFLFAWIGGLIGSLRKGNGLRTFTLSTGIQNYGFLPLPILVELFPDNSGPSGLVFVFGVGAEIAMWTVGFAILTGRAGLKSVINGPFIALTIALILNYTGLYLHVPGVITTSVEMLGRCAIPMSIFMIGATMSHFFRHGILDNAFRVGAISVLVRLGFHAALILAVAFLFPISSDLTRLLIVQAAMPSAITPIVLARLYGGQPQVAIQIVMITSFVSLLTIPFVIAEGLRWMNL
jgi:predicted permease